MVLRVPTNSTERHQMTHDPVIRPKPSETKIYIAKESNVGSKGGERAKQNC